MGLAAMRCCYIQGFNTVQSKVTYFISVLRRMLKYHVHIFFSWSKAEIKKSLQMRVSARLFLKLQHWPWLIRMFEKLNHQFAGIWQFLPC